MILKSVLAEDNHTTDFTAIFAFAATKGEFNMKRFRSTLALITAVLMLLAVLPAAADAAMGPVTVTAGSAPAAAPYQMIDIPVTISAQGGYEAHAIQFNVQYNIRALRISSVSYGELLSGVSEDAQIVCDTTSVPGNVYVCILCPGQGITGEGVLLNLHFMVISEEYTYGMISILNGLVSYYPVSGDPETIPTEFVNGSYAVYPFNANDYAKLLAFLETTDGSGVKNGRKLNRAYNPSSPVTWCGLSSVGWAVVGNEARLVSLDIDGLALAGTLDLSGCSELIYLDCSDNMLEGLTLTGCSKLETLYCRSNELEALVISNLYALRYFDCRGNMLQSLRISGSPLIWQGVLTAGEGGWVSYYSAESSIACAEPDEGYRFSGWYNGNTLVSEDAQFDLALYSGSALTAVFDYAPYIYGDANMDGELSFADISALYALIIGGGETTPEQVDLADFNRDGALTFGDISALYNHLIQA